ncbi:MAG: YfhO family protein [Lachnospiraceae bacterium]|nr:YfhO family protein [Lachnospiraceae bacterium]
MSSFEKVRSNLSEAVRRTDRRLIIAFIIAAEVLYLLAAGISYHQRVSHLDRREFTQEQLQEYAALDASYVGDQIGEGTEAGLYVLFPTSELLLQKSSYRCTVTYISSSDGTFLQTNADTDYYNVMDSAVIYLTSSSDTATEEFRLNADLNILMQIYYDGVGSVQILDLVIEETAVAANISLFYRILFLGIVNVLLGVWYYHKKYSFSVKQIYLFFGLLTLGIMVSYPLLTNETLLGDDIYYHLYRIEGIKEGLLCGQFPVRINPVFYNGYGYATSVFYGELLLYFPALLRIIGFKLTTCYNVFVIAVNILICFGTWYCFSRMIKDTGAAAAATFLYVMAPYRLLDLYVRAAVGEYCAMIFLPFVIYGLFRVYTEDPARREYKWCYLPLVIGLSGIIQTHVLTGEMTAILILAACGLLAFYTFRKKRFLALVKSVCLTILLNLWFLLPFVDYYLTQNVKITAVTSTDLIQDTGILLPQLLGVFSIYSRVHLKASSGIQDEMMLYLGLALVLGMILCGVMILAVGKEERSRRRQAGIVLLMACLSSWMATVYFPWDRICTMFYRYSEQITNLISSLQFTWRFLAPATALAAAATGLGLALLHKKEGALPFAAAALCLCMLTGIGGMYDMYQMFNEATLIELNDVDGLNTATNLGGGEYTIAGSSYEAATEIFEPRAYDGVSVEAYEKQGTNITLTVTAADTDGYVLLPLYLYKGYHAESADGLITDSCLVTGEGNVMQLNIPAGYSGTVSISYQGFWYWKAADFVSVLTILSLLVLLYREKSRIVKAV